MSDDWRDQPATEKQKEKLAFFGCTWDGGITRGEAGDAIDECVRHFPEAEVAYQNLRATEEQRVRVGARIPFLGKVCHALKKLVPEFPRTLKASPTGDLALPSASSLTESHRLSPAQVERFRWVLKGAAIGDTESMDFLGSAYMTGSGISKSYSEAVKWLRLAAEQGNANAQNNLGVCYQQGYGVEQDFAEGEKWIRKAAEQGDASAQYHLGCLYHFGQGVPTDALQAFSWWLKAAEQGHVLAQGNMCFIYYKGELVTQDYVEAYKWAHLAAEQGIDGQFSSDTARCIEGAKKDVGELAPKLSAEELDESRRRIETCKQKIREEERPATGWYNRIIRRLAEKGDVEAQVLLPPDEPINEARRPIPSDVRREVWRRDEGKCRNCGSRERLEYDHIVPVSKGGSNTARNIELLCESCNRKKSANIQ